MLKDRWNVREKHEEQTPEKRVSVFPRITMLIGYLRGGALSITMAQLITARPAGLAGNLAAERSIRQST